MTQWFSEYWQYALVFVGVCIVAVVVFFFALRARSRHMKNFRQQENEIKRLTALKNKYIPLTSEKIEQGDETEILEAAALVYQIRFEKSEYPEGEYKKLTDIQKNIYALDVFTSDKTVTEFFTLNDTMLRSRLYPALEMIGFNEAMDKFRAVNDMYDENNENVSLDKEKLTELDEIIEKEDILRKIKLGAAKYIKSNLELL